MIYGLLPASFNSLMAAMEVIGDLLLPATFKLLMVAAKNPRWRWFAGGYGPMAASEVIGDMLLLATFKSLMAVAERLFLPLLSNYIPTNLSRNDYRRHDIVIIACGYRFQLGSLSGGCVVMVVASIRWRLWCRCGDNGYVVSFVNNTKPILLRGYDE